MEGLSLIHITLQLRHTHRQTVLAAFHTFSNTQAIIRECRGGLLCLSSTYRNCSRCMWEKAPSGIPVKAAFTIVLIERKKKKETTNIIIMVKKYRCCYLGKCLHNIWKPHVRRSLKSCPKWTFKYHTLTHFYPMFWMLFHTQKTFFCLFFCSYLAKS